MIKSCDIQHISGVGGESNSVLWKIVLPIDFEGLKLYHEFYVFECLFTPLILGADFLITHKAKIDFSAQSLVLCDGIAQVSLLVPHPCFLVKAYCETTIPPKSQCMLPVKIPRLKSASTVLIEPTKQLVSNHSLMGSKCVHNTSPGSVVKYLLIKPTNADVHLKKEAVKATASLIDSNDVTPLVSNDSDSHNSTAEVGSVDSEDIVTSKNLIQTAASLNIDFSYSDLDATQKQQLMSLIGENKHCFATPMEKLGTTHLHYHRIETGDSPPIRQRF